VRFSVADREVDFELRGDGRVVLFVHGLTADRHLLVDAFEPAFAAEDPFRRLYLDLPGHGASPAHPAAGSADGLVDLLTQVVLSLGGERPLLVGHQYGAYLALGVARDAPLGGLFLVNPIVQPDIALRHVPPHRVVTRDEGLTYADDDERVTFEHEVVVQTAAMLERYQALLSPAHRAADRELIEHVRRHYAMSATWSRAVAAIPGPVEVVCGREDHWGGYADALALVRASPRCRFTILPDAGPYLPLEQAAPLRRLFVSWLREAG
jgi:pimeloyl-ACP methyl ester carboxylesterase